MEDMQAHFEKLLREASECNLIRDLSTDQSLFARITEHYEKLAADIQRAIAERLGADRAT
jgi:uncharacterized protein YdcH (DUF465 family)